MIETPIRCDIVDQHDAGSLYCDLCGELCAGKLVAIHAARFLLFCIPCAKGLARCIVASVAGEGPDG